MSTNRKINMDHGFMQSIIKNQVDRDIYDKKVKSSDYKCGKNTINQQKNKKPDIATYIPPKKPKDNNARTHLFKFEFEHADGRLHTMDIYQEDDIGILSRQFAHELNLNEAMTTALSVFLKSNAREHIQPS